MNRKILISKFLGVSESTVSNWKMKKKPIVHFIEKYLSNNDLKEFIDTQKISSLELNQATLIRKTIIEEKFFSKLNRNEVEYFIDFVKKWDYKPSIFSNEWIFTNLKKDLEKNIYSKESYSKIISILLYFRELSNYEQFLLLVNIDKFIKEKKKVVFRVIVVDDEAETTYNIRDYLELLDGMNDCSIEIIIINDSFKNFSKTDAEFFLIDYLYKNEEYSGIDIIKEKGIPKSKCLIFSGEDISSIQIEARKKLNYEIKIVSKDGSMNFYDQICQQKIGHKNNYSN